ncbi:hypothetical protein KV557_00955 [Kitasatospora aureofaciens]|uniref:hypothetical protein n=1 Tax=Kitasatospora aureofaciens TaxID=1894 RepID=UPI001C43D3AE|nr:hypothetical protein [Kitasatospora aureofaciens]MBV6695692.1 hypothetical protein [Kitasatospora aureofaciens]
MNWTLWNRSLDEDQRWADARRLLTDDALPVADRIAGLLILLYVQKITTIVQLTTDHVTLEPDRVLLSLGSRPITLPAPLDALLGGNSVDVSRRTGCRT